MLVLAAGDRVQVDHAVDAVLGAHADRAVETLEARLPREVAVVDRQPDAVDAQLGEQRGVLVGEEAVEQRVEEPLRPIRTQDTGYGGPHRALVGGIAGDEVLHVHPAAEPYPAQLDARAVGVDDAVAVDPKSSKVSVDLLHGLNPIPRVNRRNRSKVSRNVIRSRRELEESHDRPHRGCGRRVGAHGVEGGQRPRGRRSGHAGACRGLLRSTATAAAAARDARAQLLDVVFKELESPWAMEIIKGVEEVARENGLGVVLSAQEGPGALGRQWIEGVAARRSAGLILVISELSPQQIARLNARNIPFVVVDPAGEPAPGVPVGRRDELERRADRHAPPARARPPRIG